VNSIEMQLTINMLDKIYILLLFIGAELGIIMGMAVGIYVRLSGGR
jgi:hypothetical protein